MNRIFITLGCIVSVSVILTGHACAADRVLLQETRKERTDKTPNVESEKSGDVKQESKPEGYWIEFMLVEVQEDFKVDELAIHVHPHLAKKTSLLSLQLNAVHSFTNMKCSQCHAVGSGGDSNSFFLKMVLDRKDLLKTWVKNSKNVKVLAAPRIIKVIPNRIETINMKSSRKLQYFRKLRDGHYVIKSEEVTTGVTIKCAIEDAGNNKIWLRSFSVSVTAVKGREELDGVNLSVGKPILSTTSINTSIKSKLGKSAVISIDSPSGGRVLISVKVTRPAKRKKLPNQTKTGELPTLQR